LNKKEAVITEEKESAEDRAAVSLALEQARQLLKEKRQKEKEERRKQRQLQSETEKQRIADELATKQQHAETKQHEEEEEEAMKARDDLKDDVDLMVPPDGLNNEEVEMWRQRIRQERRLDRLTGPGQRATTTQSLSDDDEPDDGEETSSPTMKMNAGEITTVTNTGGDTTATSTTPTVQFSFATASSEETALWRASHPSGGALTSVITGETDELSDIKQQMDQLSRGSSLWPSLDHGPSMSLCLLPNPLFICLTLGPSFL
jgi:hypothetical protein